MHRFTIKDIENLSGIKAKTWRIREQRYGISIPGKISGQFAGKRIVMSGPQTFAFYTFPNVHLLQSIDEVKNLLHRFTGRSSNKIIMLKTAGYHLF